MFPQSRHGQLYFGLALPVLIIIFLRPFATLVHHQLCTYFLIGPFIACPAGLSLCILSEVPQFICSVGQGHFQHVLDAVSKARTSGLERKCKGVSDTLSNGFKCVECLINNPRPEKNV
jgi:hypothetical protein